MRPARASRVPMVRFSDHNAGSGCRTETTTAYQVDDVARRAITNTGGSKSVIAAPREVGVWMFSGCIGLVLVLRLRPGG